MISLRFNNLHIEPRVRLLILVVSSLFAFLCADIVYLGLFYLILILPIILINNRFKIHLKTLFFGFVPIFLSFILLYIIVIDDPSKKWNFINQKVITILVITSIFQALFLITHRQLLDFLLKMGVKNENLLYILGGIASTRDLITRGEKIIDARYSRGFIGKRAMANKLFQLPKLFIPLFIGVLRTSHERADDWSQKDMGALLNSYISKLGVIEYSFCYNLILILVCLSFLGLTVLSNG